MRNVYEEMMASTSLDCGVFMRERDVECVMTDWYEQPLATDQPIDRLLKSLPLRDRATVAIEQAVEMLHRTGTLRGDLMPVSLDTAARASLIIALACLPRGITVQHAIGLLNDAPQPVRARLA